MVTIRYQSNETENKMLDPTILLWW